jgi:hypothetical protein
MLIRDFIYLDSGRLYSLYSQIFNGVVNNTIKSSNNNFDTESVANKLLSGETVHSSAKEGLTEIENRTMFDDLYNQLEEKLKPVTTIIDRCADVTEILDSAKSSFIYKIIGTVSIHDYSRLSQFMDKFNQFGEIIAQATFRNLSETAKKGTSVKNIINVKNLNLDKDITNSISFVSQFFSNNGIEVISFPFGKETDLVFRNVLSRDCLRIDENILRRLYGCQPCIPWTIVGQITSYPREGKNLDEVLSGAKDSIEKISMADSFMKMFDSSTDVESVFFDSEKYKKINVAPIAIYVEKELDV